MLDEGIKEKFKKPFTKHLFNNFIIYIKIHTTSDSSSSSDKMPSNEIGFNLDRLLVQELKDLSITNVQLVECFYFIDKIPAS
jgi:hypothetical protein